MKYLAIIFSLILISCTVTDHGAGKFTEEKNTVGTWSGYIERFSTTVLPDDKGEPYYKVIVLNCGKIPEIYVKLEEEGSFQKYYQNYDVLESSGSLLMNIIHDGGAWVESQTWGIVFISSQKADIQWSRMVSNVKAKETHSLRSFGELGYGEMKKVSNSCEKS
ncbi:hypothetical protein ACJJJB_10690 [Microbulbifer sp. ANSA001]|uniref:hypothetical protein n=1 Tax=Microbulbifer sp. ANSA001 TaxID=3243358 RepID=UPI0040410B1B